MTGTAEIYKVLIADTGVKNLVSKTGTSPNFVYKMAVGTVEPNISDPATAWGINDTTCLIYQTSPNQLAEVYDVSHTVNCRSNTEAKAKALSVAVANALHRVFGSNTFFTCVIEPVIQPADTTDNFNVPVTVRVMGRN